MGGHTTTSPDKAWTVTVMDGDLSAGGEGLRMKVFKGEESFSSQAQKPTMTFEAPLPLFDARASETKAEWINDGKDCVFTLATYDGQSRLVISPSENQIRFDSNRPAKGSLSGLFFDWLLLLLLSIILVQAWAKLSSLRRRSGVPTKSDP